MPLTRKRVVGEATQALLISCAGAELNYSDHGMSLRPFDRSTSEVNWHEVDQTRTVGHGEAVFRAVGDALMHWQLNRGAGLYVRSASGIVRVGETVAVAMPIGFMAVTAICRVVAVISEPRRIGFAYGSLPGHPERGEEAFIVEIADDDAVTVTIRSLSRPAAWFTRVGAPVASVVQRRAVDRYLVAAERIASSAATE